MTPVRFIAGSRKLFEVPRQVQTLSFSLEQLIAGMRIDVPATSLGDDGFRILSAPQAMVPDMLKAFPGYVMGGYQEYRRHYIDMDGDFARYLARFSSKTRSTFNRKRRKLEDHAKGSFEIEEFRDPTSFARFFDEAAPLSRKTYQARLLDAGLPESGEARHAALVLAKGNALRAYLLRVEGKAIAYLYLPITGTTAIYDHLGYDPEFAQFSPGTVLQLDALERLFAEGRCRYFDFTEGDGAHKEMFGTDFVPACSFFLLRGGIANRILLGALDTFDGSIALAKRMTQQGGVLSAARKLSRW